jgi:hypothetical protein
MPNELVPSKKIDWSAFQQYVYKLSNHVYPQVVMRFPNGYGASIIPDTYHPERLVELAVVRFAADGEFHITYETPVTYDVLRLDAQELIDTLTQIMLLPWHDHKVLFEEMKLPGVSSQTL